MVPGLLTWTQTLHWEYFYTTLRLDWSGSNGVCIWVRGGGLLPHKGKVMKRLDGTHTNSPLSTPPIGLVDQWKEIGYFIFFIVTASPSALPLFPYLLLMIQQGARLLKELCYFASKAFLLFTPWSKQQISLLPLSAVIKHNPRPTSCL